jgi:hypothetical protein
MAPLEVAAAICELRRVHQRWDSHPHIIRKIVGRSVTEITITIHTHAAPGSAFPALGTLAGRLA